MNLTDPVEWADEPRRPADDADDRGPGGCAVLALVFALVVVSAVTGAAFALFVR